MPRSPLMQAQDAWEAELVKAFGPAGIRNERYYPEGEGTPGTPLGDAFDRFAALSTKAGYPLSRGNAALNPAGGPRPPASTIGDHHG